MSILIRNMEMPDSCFHCKLAEVCQYYKAEHYANKRHDDCPLEEASETHDKRTETHGMCLDAISRQDAIDAMGKVQWAKVRLMELPSAQQRWIPCSERLPEPRVAVLGYAPKFKNIFALYYDSVMGWMVWSPIRDDCLPNSQGDIIA